MEANEFLIDVLHRFGLHGWATDDYNKPEEETSKQMATIVESFLQLIIVVYGQFYSLLPGFSDTVKSRVLPHGAIT